jgi:hypothetical protein
LNGKSKQDQINTCIPCYGNKIENYDVNLMKVYIQAVSPIQHTHNLMTDSTVCLP